MDVILGLSFVISFCLTFFTMPFWIRKVKQSGLVWEDMNKYNHPKNVAGSGGIVVTVSFVIGVLFYIALRIFIFKSDGVTLYIFGLLSMILLLSIVGIVDDMLGWQNKGLSQRTRWFLVFIAAIPLVVIDAGSSMMSLPIFGMVDFGLLYPLVIIPLGVAGATVTYNSLAGFNGLEAGQGILIIGFLSFVAYITGSSWLALIGLTMVAALLGFLYYNKFPAKVFPGDSLTWSVGALIAGMAILGNFEKIAVFIFIPYILEAILKLRGRLEKHSFGKPMEDGSLEVPYDKIYGLEHLAIYILKKIKPSKKVYETDVVYTIWGFQLFLIIIAYLIFII